MVEINLEETENMKDNLLDKDALDFFLPLKQQYEEQRQPLEHSWTQAIAAYYMTDKLDKIYEGRAQVQIPIMNWKVNGIVARINRVLFGVEPIGRYEDKKIGEDNDTNDIVDLWNKFVFQHQLTEIEFISAFKDFTKNKTIQGTAVAKISQEFETKNLSFFENEEPEEVVVKDNTFFRNILLTEFYSDINKQDINDSQACIHSTVVTVEELIKNRKRKETEVFEIVDQETGEVIGTEEEEKEVGLYKNLNLLNLNSDGSITLEQTEYMQQLGLNAKQSMALQKTLKETRKTGFVQLDECYGNFSFDGEEPVEAICTIANGRIVIRLETTPFKHKKYNRPFIVGTYQPIPNSLYGTSNVILGLLLLQELNAARAQAMDARTRSVSPMWYIDTLKQTKWDKVWRPNGVVKGQGQNGITPLLNPYLGNITIQDSQQIQRDLDQLWSLSPVQEGTTDSRLIPSTARGTLAVIAQNDMPLNEIINNAINRELKPFLEMIFERNLVFKTVEDLKTVWTDEELERVFQGEQPTMRDLMFDANIKILGNLELSNEVAHQQGYLQFITTASQIPPLARRLDWKELGDKLLRSFGIKDDSDGEIWLPDELVAEIQQEQQQAQQQAEQKLIERDQQKTMFEQEVKTEGKIVELQAEGLIERTTGQKVD